MMRLNRLIQNKPLLVGVLALLAGQVLYFVGFTTLHVLALVYVLAVGLPYPQILRSMVARLVVGLLLAFSCIQLMAVAQFFVLPETGFAVLSVLVTLCTLGVVAGLRRYVPDERLVWATRHDLAAGLAVLCFVVPFAALCFSKNDPAHLMRFGSVQSADGASHYIAISEMSGTQHLNYRTVQYYPKGFHLASAYVMHGLHANQRDLSWVMNARVYVATYIFWGAVVMYVSFYLLVRLLRSLGARLPLPGAWAAICLGPVLALLYLFPFAFEGFINYYYVCAAVIAGLLYVYDWSPGRARHSWFMAAYLLLVFGVLMSWGPLLAPALLALPALYVLAHWRGLRVMLRRAASPPYRWLVLLGALQAVPLYMHVAYADLNSQQGLTATGALTKFHYGIVLAGLGLTAWLILGSRIPDVMRRLAVYVLLPQFAVVGLLACIQYAAVGELRYYAIKTSYLLEILLIITAAALLLAALMQSKLDAVQRWVAAPVLLGFGVCMLIGLTANPLHTTRRMFAPLAHFGSSAAYDPHIHAFTRLGLEGQLNSTNNIILHYDATAAKLTGNAILPNWANLMQHSTDGSPAAGACSGRIFKGLVYGDGSPAQQAALIQDVRECIGHALARGRPYIIVTDKQSVPHLRELFGDRVTYLY